MVFRFTVACAGNGNNMQAAVVGYAGGQTVGLQTLGSGSTRSGAPFTPITGQLDHAAAVAAAAAQEWLQSVRRLRKEG